MPPPVFRFAPSPNGYLHLGHAFSALLNFDLARQSGGRFLLRIEDIDTARCRPEFEAAIYEDLAWLGIDWETPVRRQSDHLADYRAALEKLAARGLVYPAFESRAEIARLVAQREAQRALAARSRRRAALSGDGEVAVAGRARAAARIRARPMRCGSTWRRPARGSPASRLDRAGRRSRWRDRRGGRPAGGVGRRHSRAQGDADQLSPLGGDRRRPAGRHRRGARRRTCSGRPACTGCCSICSACRSRPTGTTAWFSMTRDASCRSRPAATGLRELRAGGATPADIRRLVGLALIAGRQCCRRSDEHAFGVTPRARHGMVGPAWSGESWRRSRAHSAQRGRRRNGRRKSVAKRCRRQGAQARGHDRRSRHGRGGARRVRARGPHAADRNSRHQRSAGDLRPRRARAALGRYHQGGRRTPCQPRDVVCRCRAEPRSRAWRAAGFLRSARARAQRRGFAGRPGDGEGPAVRRSRFPKSCRPS